MKMLTVVNAWKQHQPVGPMFGLVICRGLCAIEDLLPQNIVQLQDPVRYAHQCELDAKAHGNHVILPGDGPCTCYLDVKVGFCVILSGACSAEGRGASHAGS